ncbi:MAG TPA: N-acetylmuramic acid 6-phosphate etherase [Abditibacteriaceae bacterium]|nr:N-acetylmuramic acid 6-phosphate etherase [Abditibacteriaceae bacterium]
MSDLSHLPTEAVNPQTADLSRLPTLQALELINDEDHKVAPAVRLVLPAVTAAVDAIAARMAQDGGRLFYIGAGTSGRLGVVDASECPPTFGTPPEWVQGIIAGGTEAMFSSREGAEDMPQEGAAALRERGLGAADCVVGLAASGRTPFVLGALQYAREVGALTVGITVNPDAAMQPLCDIFIAPLVGPEAIAGSTRMKSGTAQKMVLNMISTGIMLRLGRVDGNLMTEMRPWCDKLVDRAQRLVMRLAHVDAPTAQAALDACDGNVRDAVQYLSQVSRTG